MFFFIEPWILKLWHKFISVYCYFDDESSGLIVMYLFICFFGREFKFLHAQWVHFVYNRHFNIFIFIFAKSQFGLPFGSYVNLSSSSLVLSLFHYWFVLLWISRTVVGVASDWQQMHWLSNCVFSDFGSGIVRWETLSFHCWLKFLKLSEIVMDWLLECYLPLALRIFGFVVGNARGLTHDPSDS